MAEKNVSVAAGTACVTCNYPDPCLFEINVADFDNQTYTWPIVKKIHVKALDKGTGVKGTLTVKGKCHQPGCPTATLESGTQQIEIPNETAFPVTINYKEQDIKSIWSYLDQIILPSDAVEAPHRYNVVTQCCTDKAVHAQIDVYPSLEVRASVGFIYEIKGAERTYKARRDEQIAARKKMDDVKPKNGNKLRDGWTLNTDQFEISHKKTVSIEYGMKICGADMSAKFQEATKKARTVKTLDNINKAEKVFSNINKYLLPDPKDSAPRKYNVFDVDIKPIQMAASYAFQRLNSVDDGTHFMGLYATPFLSAELKIDLIQLIAVYCKVDSIARKCREYLDKGGNKLDCYLKLTIGLHLAIGAAYKQDEWTFSAGKENKLALTLQGVVNVNFKKKVLFVEVVLNASMEIKTELGMKIDDHPDGVDLVAYHDGITAQLALKADISSSRRKGKTGASTDTYTYKDKMVLGAPLSESKSPIRVNLLGTQRVMTK
ncbi:hypothetical protein [Pectobacterium polaris]|uniref:hypothetical protein n=1 Tax=Pectobacterium polaris TaxID=2042057 RepID=UPI001CF17BCF|nr:hypothetical protein [Pectobacterium polaris]MCA6954209.1 hypothetical protein [Pectobacterium polaris]MCU1793816.1 hypothetical protein [Pectobacterium polaris]